MRDRLAVAGIALLVAALVGAIVFWAVVLLAPSAGSATKPQTTGRSDLVVVHVKVDGRPVPCIVAERHDDSASLSCDWSAK